MTETMPELRLYRHIVDVLLAEHESSKPPEVTDESPLHILSCIWGLYAQIHRFGRAAVTLMDNGMGQEANVLIRAMLEYTVVLHWIIERGNDGVDAFLAKQSRSIKNWLRHAEGTSLTVPPDVAAELTAPVPGIDEAKAVRAFETVCKEVDARDLYAVYGIQSLLVHPTVTTSNIYTDASGERPILTLEPSGEGSPTNISLIAHCLIWAGRDFDGLSVKHPRAAGLEKLAKQIMARPTLPPYQQITSNRGGPTRRSKRQRRKR
jgi:Family of unknown function (DUF5677)